MNKKRLSVVMAGAMLATSVAPVLAAETTGTEIAFENKATLKADILAKMATKKISNYPIFAQGHATTGNDFVGKNIAAEINGNANTFSSAYGVKVTGKDGKVKVKTTYRASEVETAIDALKAGEKVEVFERETAEFKGQLLPVKEDKLPSVNSLTSKYADAVDLKDAQTFTDGSKKDILATDKLNGKDNKLVTDVTYLNKVVTVKTNKVEDVETDKKHEFTLKDGSVKIDGRLPLDEKGNLLDVTNLEDANKFKEFAPLTSWIAVDEDPEKRVETLVDTYTLGEEPADETKETLKVADLFDGIALTARGTEIVADLNNARKAAKAEGLTDAEALVRIDTVKENTTSGVSTFTISYFKKSTDTKAEKVITVVSTDKEELNGLYKLINTGKFNVGVVAGQNRYETSVNVAKQIGLTELNKTSANNIVLVNGESLVDGLAAAPLAAELGSYQNGVVGTKLAAPLLLTEAGKLPSATKEYLTGLVANFTSIEKKAVKVHLVGGTTVLNSDLAKELKEMGFTVVRHGGDNREETSVAVAEAMSAKTKAFVVGANGEADAMSISAVAARTNAITPIIVAKAGGISTDALNYLTEVGANDVTIVGGEKALSAEEEKEINGALNGAVAMRIAGANRFETNNAIIKEFYKDATIGKAVVSVKDGVANKNELVDALSAANFAASIDAPILLASTNVTDAQKSTLLKATSNPTKVVQVGMGAERTVLETIANLLGVTNKVK